tara:strand:+ start:516 stop:1262 length:747 start_codon:yes stop_codon:yes gene_type:complete
MKFIYKYKSPNFNHRIKGTSVNYIILHYTALNNDIKALKHLCDKKNKVSSHFLINKSGKIYYLVKTFYRAWHAGKSFWKGYSDINSESIGIELDNSGHHNLFEKYNSKQINSLIKLLKDLSIKFSINQHSILGHSDIAPYRKIDPGEKFPWNTLYKEGLIFIPKKLSKNKVEKIEKELIKKKLKYKKDKALYMLKKIGYNIKPAIRSSNKYCLLIKVYQSHYRSYKITGKLDLETYNLMQFHYNELLT